MALSLPRQNYGLMSRESGGRTAFDYDTMVPIKSDALKRSLAKDRISDEVLDANCRDKSESDNEADGEPAAKLRRGGGRRKQSKPMRMFAELESLPDSEPSKPISNQVTCNSKCFDGIVRRIGLLRPPASNPLVCELCHKYFPTDITLKDHVDQVHTMVFGEDTTKDALCPTKYHVLGKELIQESDFESVGKSKGKDVNIVFSEIKDRISTVSEADEDSRGSADWTPVKEDEDGMTSSPESSKAGDNNHEPVTNSSAGRTLQAKLFPVVDDIRPLPGMNPGSQLEIPHKISDVEKSTEFLASAQTYEAGVQSEIPSQASAAATTSWDPAKSRIFHPDAYCEICDREFCNKYFLKTHKANKHGIYDSNLTGMEIPTSVNNDLFFNVLSQHQHPPSSTVLPKSSPQRQAIDPAVSLTGLPLLANSCGSAEHSSPFTPVKSSATDADECCEICQKHFTSRSQLKRHRQEIHGLSSQGSDGSKRSSIGGLPVGSPGSNSVSASVENPSTPHPLLLPHLPTTSSCSVPNVLSNFGPMTNLSNLMFLNPFNPPLAVIPPLFPTPGLGFRPSTIPLPQLPIQDVQKGTSGSRFPDSPAVPNSLLQSMGVLNAEALMELYRKELCSNYLMRSQETSNRSGLFSAGMAGFQSGMSTSLASSLPFPLPGKLGSQDSVKVKFEMSSENAEVCEVCKKTFVNKQSLVSHILVAHHSNQDGSDLASELMKLDKLSEDHHFEKTVFSNMAAAKLVDRVQCDICSKEVCNKYFLKTHKIKVHGWDPVSGEREMLDKPVIRPPSPPQSQNSVLEPPIPDLMNVEKPKEEELLQMGIDPEAYCEICKKEFCNKYFLKTHKQNIHGIKTGGINPPENRTNPQAPLQANPLTAAQLSLLVGSQSLHQSLPPVLNAPPSLMSILDAGGLDGAGEKRSWKWKDPVNAMRVTCEICNKVLCNKYFLKTHMMKRHGVNYDTITGQLTTSVKGQAPWEYAPSRDARDETLGSDELSSLQQTVLSTTDKQNPLSFHAVIRHSGISEERPLPEEAIERNDNEFRFTPCRPTDRHDRGDRCNGIEMEQKPLAVGSIHSESSKALDLTSAATTVMAKTWHVPSDDHQHADEMAGTEYRPGNNIDLAPPSAEVASHRMAAEDDENVKDASRGHSVKEGAFNEAHELSDTGSQLSSNFEESRNQGCVQNFVGPGKYDSATAAEIAKSAIANHIRSQLNKKLFRCTHCRDRFHSRSQCELHICSAHPLPEGHGPRDDRGSEKSGDLQSGSSSNESSSSVNSLGYLNGYASTKPQNFSGDPAERRPAVPGLDLVSKQPVTYAQPIDPANLSSILMQPFLLKEDGGEKRFAASLVYLPALRKINETVSVTFSLTPILQH